MEELFPSLWITIATALPAVVSVITLMKFVIKPLCERQTKRKELSDKIRNQYYGIIQTVKAICSGARKVRTENVLPLQQVNQLLHDLNGKVVGINRQNGTDAIDVNDIAHLFSDKAKNCYLELQPLYLKLIGLRKPVPSWLSVQSKDVILYADCIVQEWESLLEEIAHKRHIRLKMLQCEYDEWAKGLR